MFGACSFCILYIVWICRKSIEIILVSIWIFDESFNFLENSTLFWNLVTVRHLLSNLCWCCIIWWTINIFRLNTVHLLSKCSVSETRNRVQLCNRLCSCLQRFGDLRKSTPWSCWACTLCVLSFFACCFVNLTHLFANYRVSQQCASVWLPAALQRPQKQKKL